jgi:hypothetical protein
MYSAMQTLESLPSISSRETHCHGLNSTHGINAEISTRCGNGRWITLLEIWSEETSARIESLKRYIDTKYISTMQPRYKSTLSKTVIHSLREFEFEFWDCMASFESISIPILLFKSATHQPRHLKLPLVPHSPVRPLSPHSTSPFPFPFPLVPSTPPAIPLSPVSTLLRPHHPRAAKPNPSADAAGTSPPGVAKLGRASLIGGDPSGAGMR